MILTIDQRRDIVVKNPHKELVEKGRKIAEKLMLHLHGVGMDDAIERDEFLESADVYKVRKKYSISNKDIFARLLEQENQVFSAKGGSTYFNLPESQEKQMHGVLSEVRYGLSLRKWIEKIGIDAYRADPMSIILIEVESISQVGGAQLSTPKAYPTYKSTHAIYDYYFTGRRLEYVVFRLKAKEAIAMGVIDEKLKDYNKDFETDYYRIIDDAADIVVKRDGESITIAPMTTKNPILNTRWAKCPGFITSDLFRFNDPMCRLSPLDNVVELADCFLKDRSVRELQKKYHGFAKAVEPMISCATCAGTGYTDGGACRDCTPKGAEKGLGYKLRTTVGDVAKFPIDMLKEAPSFDFKRIFGYVTPDIESWNKQDMSLEKLYQLMDETYWGSARMNDVKDTATNGQEETATKTMINMRARYAHLNDIADWCEKTENMIADLIGKFWFENWKQAGISYGRHYVLETPFELFEQYKMMKASGAPSFMLFEQLEMYYHAMYQNNAVELAIRLKLLYTEPWPHNSITEVKMMGADNTDYLMKLYFAEWYSAQNDAELVRPSNTPQKLRESLKQYVLSKDVQPAELPQPSVN